VYALAAQGQAGVERLLAIMEKDIRTNMVLTGVTTLRDVGPDLLAVSAIPPGPGTGS
jgi:L-lactate dehydrogenase (cytochrome)